ncbi:hypothetical protein V1291_003623 [Nitrobacteraceae bacterium AZCC 1564]
MDSSLPGGDWPDAIHEVAGGHNGATDGAAAVLTRTTGKVLWRITRPDLLALTG